MSFLENSRLRLTNCFNSSNCSGVTISSNLLVPCTHPTNLHLARIRYDSVPSSLVGNYSLLVESTRCTRTLLVVSETTLGECHRLPCLIRDEPRIGPAS
jgi:hypothetical protein